MATSPKAVDANEATRKRLRSPAYPYWNLETAIGRARTFHQREGRNAAALTVAATHWGYEGKSSAAAQAVAALMSFGLMQDEGTGDKRKVKLTQTALKILLDNRTDSSERDELIRQAALAPKIHKQIWEKWGAGISDENLRHALLFEWEIPFNENSVDGFIREYRDTIAFAKLAESDKFNTEVQDSGGEDVKYVPQVGDYVQWEARGILQLPEPKRVARLSSDGGFAFFEGSQTGVPVGELRKEETPISPPNLLATNLFRPTQKTNNVQEDVYSIPEGRIIVQWPASLSAESVAEVKEYLKLLERKIERSKSKDAAE